ncbi:MAG: metallophosphoesterase [Elusimicrobia bacterium]|nr:metallophosphoesterase [Elusimicrobiota bacterium]
MPKRFPWAFLCLCAVLSGLASYCPAAQRAYTRLVVLSDPHLPGQNVAQKTKVLETVNKWKDVNAVALTGDITETAGTEAEYAFAKKFFAKLKKPIYPIAGNHDYIYGLDPDGKMRKGTPAERQAKLKLFQDTFNLPATHYAKKFGRYLCLFISNDDLDSDLLTVMSSATLSWLQDELQGSPDAPTIIFFHAPLEGTIQSENEVSGRPSFFAQPADLLRELLRRNPQVFMWVSGHTHIAATNARFADRKINLYDGRVAEIHNSDMDGRSYLSDKDHGTTSHDTIWIDSLFLYQDKVVVKTYDHKKKSWLKALTREIRPPTPKKQP